MHRLRILNDFYLIFYHLIFMLLIYLKLDLSRVFMSCMTYEFQVGLILNVSVYYR